MHQQNILKLDHSIEASCTDQSWSYVASSSFKRCYGQPHAWPRLLIRAFSACFEQHFPQLYTLLTELGCVLTHRTGAELQHCLACAPAQIGCTYMVRACSVSAAHHVPWLQNLVQRLQGPEAGIKSEKKRFGYEHMTTLLRERVITSLFEEDSPGLGWGGGRGGGIENTTYLFI